MQASQAICILDTALLALEQLTIMHPGGRAGFKGKMKFVLYNRVDIWRIAAIFVRRFID
jgi:hypothetical protein